MSARLISGILLIAALAVVGWRVWSPQAGSPPVRQATDTPPDSNYYMRNATIHQMTDSGTLAYRMRVGQALHYPDDSARLRDIHIHYVRHSDTWWQLQAARGRIPPGRHDIHLMGGVTVHHPLPQDQLMTAVTDNAWVYTQTGIIETKAHVTATAPHRVTQGDGMHINTNNDRMRLIDNVQSRYAP